MIIEYLCGLLSLCITSVAAWLWLEVLDRRRVLTPLEKLPHLGYIQICNTNVTDITPLTFILYLEGVDVFGMKSLDLTPLEKMKNIKNIYK